MPFTPYTIPTNDVVDVDGVLWTNTGTDTGPIFPPVTLAFLWGSPSFYELTSQYPDMEAGRSLTIQGLGTNGWYNLWIGNEDDLPVVVNTFGQPFTAIRAKYTLSNDCEYLATGAIQCLPVTFETVIEAVATIDRATIEAGDPEVGDSYLVVSGEPNVWEAGTIVEWNGSGWDATPVADGEFVQTGAGVFWQMVDGAMALIITPLIQTNALDFQSFTLVSSYPAITLQLERNIVVTGTFEGNTITIYEGNETYFNVEREFFYAGVVTNISVTYTSGPCTWVIAAVVSTGPGEVDPPPPSGFLNNFVQDLRLDSDGSVLITGGFTAWTDPATSMNRAGRLLPNLGPDRSYAAEAGTALDNIGLGLEIDAAGNSVVCGFFSTFNGNTANRIVRILPNGDIDPSFVTGTGFFGSYVQDMAIMDDGTIICGGSFSSYNGTTANRIIALNPDGTINTSWDFGTGVVGDYVQEIIKCANGDIMIVGPIDEYNGTATPNDFTTALRIKPDGTINTDFVDGTGFNQAVQDMVELPDGRFLFCGIFTEYNGEAARNVAMINPDGTLDAAFMTNALGVSGIGMTQDVLRDDVNGKFYLGGWNTDNPPAPADRIIRLNPDGTRDDTFNIGTGTTGRIASMQIDRISNTLVAGGSFTLFNGLPRYNVVRLSI